MVFFNAQFIIIIGIIIIIYFLYKEINLLHKKINRLELDVLNNNLISNNIIPSNIIPSNTIPSNIIPSNTIPSNTIPINKNIIYMETNNISSSSEHIEIYSNDDENLSSIPVEETVNNDIKINEETVNEETVNEETVNNDIITINNYDKMKVNDLKKIAKDNKINLYKNDGKLKNKKELIENILNLKNI
jgi:hypothetical protein